MVPHEGHGEDEIEDSEDGVQPEKVVAGGGGDQLPSGLGSQAGVGVQG